MFFVEVLVQKHGTKIEITFRICSIGSVWLYASYNEKLHIKNTCGKDIQLSEYNNDLLSI